MFIKSAVVKKSEPIIPGVLVYLKLCFSIQSKSETSKDQNDEETKDAPSKPTISESEGSSSSGWSTVKGRRAKRVTRLVFRLL